MNRREMLTKSAVAAGGMLYLAPTLKAAVCGSTRRQPGVQAATGCGTNWYGFNKALAASVGNAASVVINNLMTRTLEQNEWNNFQTNLANHLYNVSTLDTGIYEAARPSVADNMYASLSPDDISNLTDTWTNHFGVTPSAASQIASGWGQNANPLSETNDPTTTQLHNAIMALPDNQALDNLAGYVQSYVPGVTVDQGFCNTQHVASLNANGDGVSAVAGWLSIGAAVLPPPADGVIAYTSLVLGAAGGTMKIAAWICSLEQ